MARDGREGLAVYNQQGADVILVDYHMAGMGGLMTVKELRKRAADVCANVSNLPTNGKKA